MARTSLVKANTRTTAAVVPSRDQAPALPVHIQAVGPHHRLQNGRGYYWIGAAHSVPLNDDGLVIKGIVLYNDGNCLFLNTEETQEAVQEAQQMLHSFFEGEKSENTFK